MNAEDAIDERLRAAARAMTPEPEMQARLEKRLAATFAAPPTRSNNRPAAMKIASLLLVSSAAAAVFWHYRTTPPPVAVPAAAITTEAVMASEFAAHQPLLEAQKVKAPTAKLLRAPLAVTRNATRTETAKTNASPPAPPAADADTLSEEQKILGKARAAFDHRDDTAARTALSTYDQRFAHGELNEERDALWIYILAREGRSEEARARFTAFERAHTTSPLRDRLRTAIEAGELP